MDIHKNARLTLRSREALARMVVEQGATRKAAAAAFRVGAKTAAKWVSRFRDSGAAGLLDRSSRPHRSPRRLSESLSSHVVELRRTHMPGYEIARRARVSPSSVSRILRCARLSRWRDLNPPPPIQRYEHPAPGDLVHLDIKGMTRFSEVSLRGDGRLRGKKKHPGFLRSAVEFFARHGIGVRALLTDNGSSYRSSQFRAACQQMQLKHRRTRPYTPRTNGKAERFIQTALREWAYAKHWTESEQRDAHLKPWTDYYNLQRPHGSLSYKPPISRSEIGTTS